MSLVPVDALDARGDGIAVLDGRVHRVPFAAPGDRLTSDGVLQQASSLRVDPPCPLFGRCGGCQVLHLSDEAYARWKVERVAECFAAEGLRPAIDPLRRAPLASRRRATLTAARAGSAVPVGYHARGSHDVVDVAHCPALAPGLACALAPIRRLAAAAARLAPSGRARITATLCSNGIDIDVRREAPSRGRSRRPTHGRRAHSTAAPVDPGPIEPPIIRLAVDGETHLSHETPTVRFGNVAVPFPSGAFLQASLEGERHLTELVLAALEPTLAIGNRRVADCFCGLGTFTLPLAQRARITAVDADRPALAALEQAVRGATGLAPVRVVSRDLAKHPLSPQELDEHDAVVFDPPRAGAERLARALAASSVPTVVAVSCEPSTLARDCAIMAAAGYKITHVTPVDQFVGTPHIEAVTVLRRDA